MSYKLVAVDMDGTLLNEKLEISSRTKEAIVKAKEKNVQVTLATGRMYQSVLPFAQELDLAIPLITYNGALVKDSATGEVYYHEPIPLDVSQEIIALVKDKNVNVNLYVDDTLYVKELNERTKLYVSIAKVEAIPVGDLASFLKFPPTKILLIGEPEELAKIAEEIRGKLTGKVEVTTSNPRFLEIISHKVTKGQALKTLAEKLRIKQEEVVAFGDSYNDLSMIEYAGLGVAMGNAPQDIKDKADLLALSNKEDGVADVLERVVLS